MPNIPQDFPFRMVAGQSLDAILDVRCWGVYVSNYTAQWVSIPDANEFVPPNTRQVIPLPGSMVARAMFQAPNGITQPVAVTGQTALFTYTERVVQPSGGVVGATALQAQVTLERFLRANIPVPGNAGRLIELIDYDRGLWLDDGVDPFWSLTGEVIMAKAYGARGNGVTDDSAAIQAAMAAGDVVYLGPGTFQIAAGLTYTDNKVLLGAGVNLTTIRGNLGGALLGPVNPAVRAFNLRIADMRFDNTSRATAGGICLDLTNMSDGHFRNIVVVNGEVGVRLRGNGGAGGCLYNRFFQVIASTCGRGFQGIVAGGGPDPSEHTFIGCRTVDSNGAAAWDLDAGAQWTLIGCAAETFTTSGLRANASPGPKIYGMRFENAGGVGDGIEKTVNCNRIVVLGAYFNGLVNNTTGFTPALSAINAGIAAGSAIVGSDTAGRITFTTTAAPPGAGADLMTVTYTAGGFSTQPSVVVSEANGQPVGFGVYLPSTAVWHLICLVALGALTQYVVNYIALPMEAEIMN